MNPLARSLVGAAVSAAAVYFLDPVSGHRRRLMFQDGYRRAAQSIDRSTRELRNDTSDRARKLASRGRGAFAHKATHKSDKVVNRLVCGAVRHSVSHPADIAVAVDRGHVFLRGNLLPHEHQRVLDAVRSLPGVMVVTDHLSEQAGDGEYLVDRGRVFKSAARSGWSTTGRVLAGCAGGALIFWGVRERKALGDFASSIAEDIQHALDRNFREGVDAVKEMAEAGEEGLADAVRSTANKVEEGMDWADSTSSDVIEEYAQQRRRADATH